MNKAELSVKLSEKLNMPKKRAEEMIETLTDFITEELTKNGEVTIAGFGTWSARVRAARMGVNPQKPSEKIQIPEVRVPKFKAGKTLKDALKKKA
jgi:nucleoid DNA-binding protein